MASNGVDISSLKAIYVFQNINNHRIIQSIDLHIFENGEMYGVQRSYLLLMDGRIKVVNPNYFSRIEGCDFSKMVLGKSFGAWLCTYTIGLDHPPRWLHTPSQFTCLSYGHLQAITRLPTRDITPPSCIIHEGVNMYYENPLSFSRSNDIHASESAQHRGTNWYRFSQGAQGPSHNIQGTYAAQASSSQNRNIGSSSFAAFEQSNENPEGTLNEHNANGSNASNYQMRIDLNFPPLDDPDYIEVDIFSGELTEPIPVRKQTPPIGYIDSLTVEDFRRYFHLDRVEAAAALDISYASLQKRRAKLGITHWPYIKLRTLDKLSRKLQEEAERGNANRLPGSMNVHQWQEHLTREKEEIRNNPAQEIPREIVRLQKLIAQRRRARAMKAAAAAAAAASTSAGS